MSHMMNQIFGHPQLRFGGSLEEKIEEVVDVFRSSARHLESLQQVLRSQENRHPNGSQWGPKKPMDFSKHPWIFGDVPEFLRFPIQKMMDFMFSCSLIQSNLPKTWSKWDGFEALFT
jgi:hypothetical protein